VRVGLKPVLRKLGVPSADVGLHAFRHGLATELVDASAPLSVVQRQLRHSDVATTLRIYTHAIPQTQTNCLCLAKTKSPFGINNINKGM
jgi:integrase